MAKAGRRARARALAMARAAARTRLQLQAAAEAARGTSTIEKLPADILGVLFGCLGFHSSLAASHASKTLHKAPDAAMRARHRLTLAAMPHGCGGDRDLSDRDWATEYLSLGATTTSIDDFELPLGATPVLHARFPRTLVCKEHDHESVADVFSPHYSRCVLRTKTDQGSFYTFIVDINKVTGEVLVFDHPKPDDYYTRPHPIEMCTGFPELDMEELIPLERYEAVGVFIGLTSMKENPLTHQYFPHAAEFGDSILLQLPVRDHESPQYEYVYIGDRCRHFVAPEPIQRFFAHLGNNHANMEVALSSTFVYYPANMNRQGVVIYAPRAAWSLLRNEREHGEGAWELCYEWDITGGKKAIKQTSRRHGGSRWNPDAPYLSDSSHDSDSGDEEGSVEGIDWEWMDLPFGFERVKFVFNRAEARHRRRAARRQAGEG